MTKRYATLSTLVVLASIFTHGAVAPAQTVQPRYDGHALEPVFSSNNTAFRSFLRLGNDGIAPAVVDVTLVDAASGEEVGTWSAAVPAKASPQFAISAIELEAGIITPPGQYVLYLDYGDAPFFAVKFQHVIWSPVTGFFESLSSCREAARQPKALANVHTSQLAAYPSLVIIHNEERTAREVRITARESSSGTFQGSYDLPEPLPPFASTTVSAADIEAAIGWQPASGDFHMTVAVETRVPGASFFTPDWEGWVTHLVQNDVIGSLVNMTPHCEVTVAGALPPN